MARKIRTSSHSHRTKTSQSQQEDRMENKIKDHTTSIDSIDKRQLLIQYLTPKLIILILQITLMMMLRSIYFILLSICYSSVSNHPFVAMSLMPTTSKSSTRSTLSSRIHNGGSCIDKSIISIPESTTTRLYAAEDGSKKQQGDSPRIRFTGFADDNNNNNFATSTNPLDTILSWLSSDIVSIALGTIGLLIVVVNRLTLLDVEISSSADALTSETRADLLAVFACGSVLLNGVTKLDVTAALAESVTLEGNTLSETDFVSPMEDSADETTKETISWAFDSLLSATPAKTVVLIQKKDDDDNNNDDDNGWIISCRGGIIPSSSSQSLTIPEKTPILDRVGSPGNVKETYLPTLQALPGRFEFTYLPSNTQLVILIPISSKSESSNEDGSNSVLVLGGNTAKSFTPRDIAWSRIVADRLGDYL